MNLETIKVHFSIIRDERQSAKVDYPLFDILFCSICAIIAGGQAALQLTEVHVKLKSRKVGLKRVLVMY